MAFDPDAYLAGGQQTKPAFDPDAYLAQQAPVPQPDVKQEAQQKQSYSPVDIAGEFASAVNRGVVNIADFLTTEQINNVLQIAGSEKRIPSIRSALSDTPASVEGNFMPSGLPKEIVRGAGEAIPSSIGVGGLLRSAAGSLPVIASGAESVGAGALRTMGSGTIAADAGYGALSGAGQETGRAVGGDTGALIGSVAAPLLPTALGAMGKSLIGSIFGNADKAMMQKTIDDFASFDSVPTAGMASGKKGLQGVENVSGKAMFGTPLASANEQISKNMQSRLKQIASEISTKEGDELAGLTIQKGISGKGGFVDRFKQKGSILWNKADSLIDESLPVSLTNTRTKLDDLIQGGKFGDILDNPKVAQIKNVIESSQAIDYATLRKLRSLVGAKIAGSELVSDIPKAELKQLYGALTADTKDIAAQSGDDALRAFERANTFTRGGHERLDDYLQRLSDKVNPDEVFKALSRGGEGTKMILTVKKSVSPQDWDVLTSNIIRKLGRSTSGQQNAIGEDALGDAFSVSKFVTDWDKLGKAKSVLFSGTPKLKEYGDNLNKIARAASVIKEASIPAANASGTAQAASRIAAGASVASLNPSVIAIAATGAAMNNAGARLMSNPNFVRWLAKNSDVKNVSSSAIAQLVGIAKNSSSDDAIDIQSFIDDLDTKKEEAKP